MYDNPSLSKLKKYIKNGGDINVKDEHDETLLIMLSDRKNKTTYEKQQVTKMMNFLIDEGANLDIVSGWHKNLFVHLISYSSDLKLIKKVVDAGINVNRINNVNDPLQQCITNIDVIEKDFEKAKLIIESRNFELWTSNTWNYLYQAINNDRFDIIEVLLENGAEIDDKFMVYVNEFNSYGERLEVIKTRFSKYYQKYLSSKKAKDFNL